MNQNVLLLSKVSDFHCFLCIFERPWEAVRGRERPWGSHWLRDLCHRVLDLWDPIRGARPLTASHGLSRPLTFVMWSVWANQKRARPLTHGLSRPLTASQICEAVGVRDADRPLTHTGRSNAFSREISQAAPRIGLHRPVCVRGRSDSGRGNAFSREISQTGPRMAASPAVRERPIGLSNLWGRVRPLTASQTDHMTLWWARPLTHTASQIYLSIYLESEVRGRERPWIWESDRPLTHTGRSNAFSRGSDCIARYAWEADRTLKSTASHGLSLRTLDR